MKHDSQHANHIDEGGEVQFDFKNNNHPSEGIHFDNWSTDDLAYGRTTGKLVLHCSLMKDAAYCEGTKLIDNDLLLIPASLLLYAVHIAHAASTRQYNSSA